MSILQVLQASEKGTHCFVVKINFNPNALMWEIVVTDSIVRYNIASCPSVNGQYFVLKFPQFNRLKCVQIVNGLENIPLLVEIRLFSKIRVHFCKICIPVCNYYLKRYIFLQNMWTTVYIAFLKLFLTLSSQGSETILLFSVQVLVQM